MTSTEALTQEILKSNLFYCPETGIFTRTVRSGSAKIGDVAGYKNDKGYIQIKLNGKTYQSHRLAWLYMTSNLPKDLIDHINGNSIDNRFINLREATNLENCRNRGATKNNKSGLKGVCFHKVSNKWRAQITIDRKPRHLGLFDTPEEAHISYQKEADKYHGEFANFGSKGNA